MIAGVHAQFRFGVQASRALTVNDVSDRMIKGRKIFRPYRQGLSRHDVRGIHRALSVSRPLVVSTSRLSVCRLLDGASPRRCIASLFRPSVISFRTTAPLGESRAVNGDPVFLISTLAFLVSRPSGRSFSATQSPPGKLRVGGRRCDPFIGPFPHIC